MLDKEPDFTRENHAKLLGDSVRKIVHLTRGLEGLSAPRLNIGMVPRRDAGLHSEITYQLKKAEVGRRFLRWNAPRVGLEAETNEAFELMDSYLDLDPPEPHTTEVWTTLISLLNSLCPEEDLDKQVPPPPSLAKRLFNRIFPGRT